MTVQTDAAAAGAIVATSPDPSVPPSELNRIENLLSLMLHEVETRYEADVAKIKSSFSALKAHWGKLLASHAGIAAFAAFVGHFL